MNNINFYEVVNSKGRWMGNYSPKLDNAINCGTNALTMAIINAKQSDGKVSSVSFDGERKLVWENPLK